jgi:hypothetical protein
MQKVAQKSEDLYFASCLICMRDTFGFKRHHDANYLDKKQRTTKVCEFCLKSCTVEALQGLLFLP